MHSRHTKTHKGETHDWTCDACSGESGMTMWIFSLLQCLYAPRTNVCGLMRHKDMGNTLEGRRLKDWLEITIDALGEKQEKIWEQVNKPQPIKFKLSRKHILD